MRGKLGLGDRSMPTTKSLAIENVNFGDAAEVDAFIEQVIASGMGRVRSDIAELQAKGLMDGDGKLLNTEVPPDMCEDSERDFGG
jgi:hypothetical protein